MLRKIIASLFTLVILTNAAIAFTQSQRNVLLAPPFTGGFNLSSGYPVDSVTGVTITTVCGVAATTQAQKNGPLFDVVTSGGTTTIFGVGAGYPDIVALAYALGVDPRNGIGGASISKCYDQKNTNHWTQATTGAIRPLIYLIQGNIYLGFSGVLSGINGLAEPFLSNSASINNRSASVFIPYIPYTSSNSGSPGNYIYMTAFGTKAGAPGATDIGLFGPSSSADGSTEATKSFSGVGDYTNGIQQTVSPYIGLQYQVLSLLSGAASTTVQANTTSASGTALVVNATNTPLSFGQAADGVTPLSARATAILVSSSIFSGPQTTTMTTAFGAWSGANISVNKANSVNVVVDGASSDIGQGSVPGNSYKVTSGGGYGYEEMLKDNFLKQGKNVSWHNFAVSGATIAQRTVDYSNSYVQNSGYQPSSTKNILIAPGISGIASIISPTAIATSAISVGTNLTLSGVTLTPGVAAGNNVTGTGIPGGTVIVSQTSGPAGGSGVYVTNNVTTASGSTDVKTFKTGTQTYSDYTTWLAAAKTGVTWTTIYSILYPDNGNSEITTYNSLVKSNAVSNGVTTVDLTGNTNFFIQPTANSDGHLTILGNLIVYNALLGPLQQQMFLLNRDIDPAANDNEPMWLSKAA